MQRAPLSAMPSSLDQKKSLNMPNDVEQGVRQKIRELFVFELQKLTLPLQQRLYVKSRDQCEDAWIDIVERETKQSIKQSLISMYPKLSQDDISALIVIEASPLFIMQELQKYWMVVLSGHQMKANRRMLALNYLTNMELAAIAEHLCNLVGSTIKDSAEIMELLRYRVRMRAQSPVDSKISANELAKIDLLEARAKEQNFNLGRVYVLIAISLANQVGDIRSIAAMCDIYLALKKLDDNKLLSCKAEGFDSKVPLIPAESTTKLHNKMISELFYLLLPGIKGGLVEALPKNFHEISCASEQRRFEFMRLLSNKLNESLAPALDAKKENDVFDCFSAQFSRYQEKGFFINHHHCSEAKDIVNFLQQNKNKMNCNQLVVRYLEDVACKAYMENRLKMGGTFMKLVINCINALNKAVISSQSTSDKDVSCAAKYHPR